MPPRLAALARISLAQCPAGSRIISRSSMFKQRRRTWKALHPVSGPLLVGRRGRVALSPIVFESELRPTPRRLPPSLRQTTLHKARDANSTDARRNGEMDAWRVDLLNRGFDKDRCDRLTTISQAPGGGGRGFGVPVQGGRELSWSGRQVMFEATCSPARFGFPS